MSKVQLKPGDYVRTEGMTEEQYHAVAKAFMAAGCGQGEYPSLGELKERTKFGWYDDDQLFHGCLWIPRCETRELTIDQILGTEPDADGWIEWHGGECPVEKGAIIDTKLRCGLQTDGTARGKSGARLWGHNGLDSDIIAYRIHQPEQEESPMTIEQLLAKANKHARKALAHQKKAAKHEVRREALIEQARALLPEGWNLFCDLEGKVPALPGESVAMMKPFEVAKPEVYWWHGSEDMTDPASWRKGDVLERVAPDGHPLVGDRYTLIRVGDKALTAVDSDGLDIFSFIENFRWISRPQGETK